MIPESTEKQRQAIFNMEHALGYEKYTDASKLNIKEASARIKKLSASITNNLQVIGMVNGKNFRYY